uniref:E3 ubiquitin-protein ligase TRIM56-like n=1 Tax=Pristiophorus japonicus TaxID=55135 RepID=UPI00398F81C4
MATSSSIADKIQNDFLNCKVCLQMFKQPKMLPCLHTYCQGCLEKLSRRNRRIQCPECRVEVDLSAGLDKLQTNFHINSLLDIFQSQAAACALCPPRGARGAVAECRGCSLYLCQSCKDHHRASHPSHRVWDLAGPGPGPCDAELRMEKETQCRLHPWSQADYYCNRCNCAICSDCCRQCCHNHKTVAIKVAAESRRAAVKELAAKLEGQLQAAALQEDGLNGALERVKATERSVRSSVESALTEVITQLFKQGDAIKQKLSDYVKEQEELHQTAVSDLRLQTGKARGTRELCDRVLSAGKARETVCLQNIVQDQIDALQAVNIPALNTASPNLAVNKSVQDLMSKNNLFSLSFGGTGAPQSQPYQPPATLPPYCASGQPRHLRSFNTALSDDEYDPKLTGISTSNSGDIIIVDEENSILKCYRNNGHLKRTISLPDEDDPCSVAVCDNTIACSANNKLYLLDMDGTLLKQLFLRGSETNYPIAAYKDQYVAVSEGTLCSISLYDVDGRVVDRVKPHGYEGNRFFFIAVNSNEEFIVSDYGNKSILILNRSGQVLSVCAEICEHGLHTSLNPYSVCVDRKDNIYVTEPGRILLFSPNGTFQEELLSTEDGLHKPRVIAVNRKNHLLVTQGDGTVCVYKLALY